MSVCWLFLWQPVYCCYRWSSLAVSSLNLAPPLTISPDVLVEDAVQIMRKRGFDQLPVVDKGGVISGVVTMGNLMSRQVTGQVRKTDPVDKALYRQFQMVSIG